MALKWREKTGWCHRADVGGLDITVWCVVNGTYAVDCLPLFGKTELQVNTMAEAKSAAIAMLRERLQELIKELDQ